MISGGDRVTEIRFNMSEVTKLAADVGRAAPAMVAPLAAVVVKSSTAIRDDMRNAAKGHQRFPSFPSSITFDVRGLSSEIGPDKNRRQGALGNILYFGTVHNGPVLPHPVTALQAERPAFEVGLAAAATAGLGKALGA
jgi:hypothetical protein